MSAIIIEPAVEAYLAQRKQWPNEPFNSVLRRELGLGKPGDAIEGVTVADTIHHCPPGNCPEHGPPVVSEALAKALGEPPAGSASWGEALDLDELQF